MRFSNTPDRRLLKAAKVSLLSVFLAFLLIATASAQLSISEGDKKPTIIKFNSSDREFFTPDYGASGSLCLKYEKDPLTNSTPDHLKVWKDKDKQTSKNISKGAGDRFCFGGDDFELVDADSVLVENVTQREIVFTPRERNITAKLRWDVPQTGDLNNTINDVWVNSTTGKFGANGNFTELERLRYEFISELPIKQHSNFYYYEDGHVGYKINVDDICTKDGSVCGFETSTQEYTVFQDLNLTVTSFRYVLNVNFWSNGTIDPSFEQFVVSASTLRTNVTLEGNNQTHLNIEDNPYLALDGVDDFVNVTSTYASGGGGSVIAKEESNEVVREFSANVNSASGWKAQSFQVTGDSFTVGIVTLNLTWSGTPTQNLTLVIRSTNSSGHPTSPYVNLSIGSVNVSSLTNGQWVLANVTMTPATLNASQNYTLIAFNTGDIGTIQISQNSNNNYSRGHDWNVLNGAQNAAGDEVFNPQLPIGLDWYFNVWSNDTTASETVDRLNIGAHNFTVSLWVKSDSATKQTLISDWPASGAGYVIQVDSGGQNRLLLKNATSSAYTNSVGSAGFLDGEWHNIIYTFDTSTGTVGAYTDIVSTGTFNTGRAGSLDNNVSLQLGIYSGATDPANASIDDVRVYNTTLSATDRANLFALGREAQPLNKSNLVARFSFTDQNAPADESGNGNTAEYKNGASTNFPTRNLVAYYSFDADSSTTAYDLTGNSNDGTYTGNAAPIGGCAFDDCATFDGNGDYVQIGSSLNSPRATDNVTFSVWINPQNIANLNTLFTSQSTDAGTGFSFLGDSNNNLRILSEDTNLVYTSAISNNAWTHVAFVRDNSTGTGSLKVYINGAIHNNTGSAQNKNFTKSLSTPRIAAGVALGANRYFNGSIDELMIFNTSLTSQQILALYNNQSARFKEAGTVTIKQFNITSGRNAINISVDYERSQGSNVSLRVGRWDRSKGYNLTDLNATARGLVAYWNFDDSFNSSVGGINGTASGNAHLNVSGRYNNSVKFDGNGDYVELPSENILDLNRSMSFGAWYFKEPSGASYLLAKRNNSNFGYNVFFDVDNNIKFVDGGGSVLTLGTLYTQGTWQHIFFVINSTGTGITPYLDGATGTTIAITTPLPQNAVPLCIGCRVVSGSGTGTAFWNGSIDEVMIFNRSLTADEVKELYVKGRALWDYAANQNATDNEQTYDYASSSGLVAAYVNSENDTLGANNGTLSGGMTWSGSDRGKIGNFTGVFDGSGDYVSMLNSVVLNVSGKNITVSAWVNPSKVEGTYTIVSKGAINNEDYLLDIQNGKIRFFSRASSVFSVGDGATIGATTINSKQWAHLAITYNGTGITAYWNGIFDGSKADTDDLNTSTQNMNIGRRNSFATADFNGSLDEVAIWNRSLSADEIRTIYLSSKEKHSNNQFGMSNATTNILVETQLISSPHQHYTPWLTHDYMTSTWSFDDTTAPVITLTSPTNTTYRDRYNYSLQLSFTAVDDLAVDSQWYSLNGGPNTSYTSPVFLTGLTSGSNNVIVYANDTAGNVRFNQTFFSLAFTPKINQTNVTNASTEYLRIGNLTGLVGWWRFDENNSIVRDYSGNGNNGTLNGGVTWNASGRVGGAYEFDGVDDSINATPFPLNGNFTMEGWFKADTLQGNIINARQDFIRLELSSNRLLFRIWDTGYKTATSSTLNTGTWYHFVAVHRHSQNVTLYLDGVFQQSINLGAIGGSSDKFYIGARGYNNDQFFNGTIDEVRIYNRSLSAQEIQDLYRATNPTFQEYPNVTLSVGVTDEDTPSGFLTARWFVDGILRFTETLSNAFESIFNWIFDKPGSTVRVEINDSSGYAVNQTFNITTTFVDPSIQFLFPQNTSYNHEITHINFTATDANLQACWYSFDGGQSNTTVPCTQNITGLGTSDGQFTWMLAANDSVGNINSSSVTFFVDATLPVVIFASPHTPANGTITTSRSLAINVTVTEDNFANITYELFNNTGGLTLVNRTTFSTQQLFINFTNLSDATYFYNVTVTDLLNNRNSTPTRTFIVQTVAPAVTLISPADGSQDTDGVVQFTYLPLTNQTIVNCSLYYQNGLYATVTSVTAGANNIIEVTSIGAQHPFWLDNLQWYVSCTDNVGLTGNSSVFNLDAKDDSVTGTPSSGGGGGGGGGGAGTAQTGVAAPLNPRSIDFAYVSQWQKGGVAPVIVKVYSQAGNLYLPNITVSHLPAGITLQKTDQKDNLTTLDFYVASSADSGDWLINITATDERTISQSLRFFVGSEKEIAERVIEEQRLAEQRQTNRLIWIVIGIVAGVAVLVILVLVFFTEAFRKR